MWRLAALLAVREIYFPPACPSARRMFDDKLMADSKVSAVGDINISPRAHARRTEELLWDKNLQICPRKNTPTMIQVAFKCNFLPGKAAGDVSYGAVLIEHK